MLWRGGSIVFSPAEILMKSLVSLWLWFLCIQVIFLFLIGQKRHSSKYYAVARDFSLSPFQVTFVINQGFLLCVCRWALMHVCALCIGRCLLRPKKNLLELDTWIIEPPCVNWELKPDPLDTNRNLNLWTLSLPSPQSLHHTHVSYLLFFHSFFLFTHFY